MAIFVKVNYFYTGTSLNCDIVGSRGDEYVTPTIIGPNSIYRDDVFGADSDVNFDTAGTVCTLGEAAASIDVHYSSFSWIEFNHLYLRLQFIVIFFSINHFGVTFAVVSSHT